MSSPYPGCTDVGGPGARLTAHMCWSAACYSGGRRAVCKTVGSAYVGSNPTPATTCENGPLAGNSRLCGPFLLCPVVCHLVALRVAVSRCPRTHSGRRPCLSRGRGNRRLSTDGHGRAALAACPGLTCAAESGVYLRVSARPRTSAAPRRPGRGPRQCRAPAPRPGAGPFPPCSSRLGRSCRRPAITSRPPVCTALVNSHAPRTRSSASGLTSANARRNVDSSAGPRAAPSTARTSGPASAPTARSPRTTSTPRSPPRSRRPAARPAGAGVRVSSGGSGTWARRSRRYWLRAAAIGEGVIGGRASLVANDGECRNFHRSARTLPAAGGHAGHIIRRYDATGHSLNSRLCRAPGSVTSVWHGVLSGSLWLLPGV